MQLVHQLERGHRRPEAGALEVQRRRAHVPAPVLLADQRVAGQLDVIEEELVEVVHVGHVDDGPTAHAGQREVEEEVGDALVLGHVLIGARQEDAVLRMMPLGRPRLLAVEQVVVALGLGLGLERGQVGAGVGLAEELAPDHLAAGDAGEVALLLLLGAVHHDRRPRQVHPGVHHRERGLMLGELLVEDHLLDDAPALAAVFDGPRRRQPALRPQLPGELALELVAASLGLRLLAPVRRQLLADELDHLAAKRFVFLGPAKVHGVCPRRPGALGRAGAVVLVYRGDDSIGWP